MNNSRATDSTRCPERACAFPATCPDHNPARVDRWRLNGGAPHLATTAPGETRRDRIAALTREAELYRIQNLMAKAPSRKRGH
jgi:hypothetical protein